MRRIAVLDAPSNLGLRPPTATSVPGCAKAPGALRDQGLLSRLGARDAGCLTPPRYDAGDWRPGDGVAHATEIAAYSRALADRIGAIIDGGEFPVILGGDCSILIGAGIAMHRLGDAVGGRIGLVFVDGHSDFRHPGNASYVGAAAGEDLALVTGRGQADLAAIESRRPYFRDIDVVVLGIRAQDEYRLDLQAAGIVTRPVPALRAEGAARSAQWARDQLVDCAGYWVHIDVDVLDPAVMPAVDAPDPGGIAFPELELLLSGLVESPHCLGVEITVFDPDYDPDGRYAAEITSAVVSGLSPVRSTAPRPDLAAARRDLDKGAPAAVPVPAHDDPAASVATASPDPADSDVAATTVSGPVADDLAEPDSAEPARHDLAASAFTPGPEDVDAADPGASAAAPNPAESSDLAVLDADARGAEAPDKTVLDSAVSDPAASNSGAVGTGAADSGVAGSGAVDSDPADSDPAGSGVAGSGAVDSGVADSGVADPAADPAADSASGAAVAGPDGEVAASGSAAESDDQPSAAAEVSTDPDGDTPSSGVDRTIHRSNSVTGPDSVATTLGPGRGQSRLGSRRPSGDPIAAVISSWVQDSRAAGLRRSGAPSSPDPADPVASEIAEPEPEPEAMAISPGPGDGPGATGPGATGLDAIGLGETTSVEDGLSTADADFLLAEALAASDALDPGTDADENGPLGVETNGRPGAEANAQPDAEANGEPGVEANGQPTDQADDVSADLVSVNGGSTNTAEPRRPNLVVLDLVGLVISDPVDDDEIDAKVRDVTGEDWNPGDREAGDGDAEDREAEDREARDRGPRVVEAAGEDGETAGEEPDPDAVTPTSEPAAEAGDAPRPERTRPENDGAEVRLLSRPLGSAPLLDSEPLPATRPGMLRPRPPADGSFGPPAAGPGPLTGFPPGVA